MTDSVLSFVCLGLFAALTLADVGLSWRRRRELPADENPWSGSSPFGQVNLWRREKATTEGRARLRGHVGLAVARGGALLGWLVFSIRAFL